MLLFTGCTTTNAKKLTDEPVVTFEVSEATSAPDDNAITNDDIHQNDDSTTNTDDVSLSINDKFASIEFSIVSGNYCRNVTHDDVEYTEMFVGNKNNFVRVATNDLEQEVFAYNYILDNFTYLYYYDGELMSKTVFNITTGVVLEDSEEYADLLKAEAEEIKIYFNDLLKTSGLNVQDLNNI